MIVVTMSRDYAESPEEVLGALADYREVRPRLLPSAIEEYTVLEGGVGAGTRIAYRLRATKKRVRSVDADVTEPGAAQLTEADRNSTLTTLWTITPAAGGSTVTVEVRWEGSTGIGGFFERRFAPPGTRRIYSAQLEALAGVLSGANRG